MNPVHPVFIPGVYLVKQMIPPSVDLSESKDNHPVIFQDIIFLFNTFHSTGGLSIHLYKYTECALPMAQNM